MTTLSRHNNSHTPLSDTPTLHLLFGQHLCFLFSLFSQDQFKEGGGRVEPAELTRNIHTIRNTHTHTHSLTHTLCDAHIVYRTHCVSHCVSHIVTRTHCVSHTCVTHCVSHTLSHTQHALCIAHIVTHTTRIVYRTQSGTVHCESLAVPRAPRVRVV